MSSETCCQTMTQEQPEDTVHLLVLHTELGPIPSCYADCERGRANLSNKRARFVDAKVVHRADIVVTQRSHATRWMCDPSYTMPQQVLGHALARAEGRTAKSLPEWCGW